MAPASAAFDNFSAKFNAGAIQLVHRVLVADTQTPVSAFLKLADGQKIAFFLSRLKAVKCVDDFLLLACTLI